MRTLLAIAAAACMGCAPLDLVFDMYIDRRFETNEQCLVAEAIERWEIATGGLVDIDTYIGLRTTSYPHQVERASDATSKWRDMSDTAIGVCQNQPNAPAQRGVILIWPGRIYEITRDNPERYNTVFLRVALHEIGHHLDLDHTSEGVMAERVSGEAFGCIEQTDVDQFCRHWGCSVIAQPCEPPPKMCEL